MRRLARSIRAKPGFAVAAVAKRGCRSHPPSLTSLRARLRRVEKLRRTSRLRLQIGAFQKDCAGVFHFVQRTSDVTGRKVNSATAIDDYVRVQSEMTRVERAVFDAVVQSQAHQVNFLDPALFQIMS